MVGGGGEQHPILRINERKETGARSAKARSMLPENCFINSSIKGPVGGRRPVPELKSVLVINNLNKIVLWS
jgi:hypothetical protein